MQDKLAQANNPNTPVDVLERLASDENIEIKEAVLLNVNTPDYTIFEMILNEKTQEDIKKLLLKNPNRVQALMEIFDNQEKAEIMQYEEEEDDDEEDEDYKKYELDYFNLRYLVLNRKVKIDHERDDPKRNLLKDPNVSIDILEKLSTDKSSDIRAEVAANPKTPIGILRKMVEDKEALVRLALAHNPNITIDIFEKLITDEVEIVKNIAKEKQIELGKIDI